VPLLTVALRYVVRPSSVGLLFAALIPLMGASMMVITTPSLVSAPVPLMVAVTVNV